MYLLYMPKSLPMIPGSCSVSSAIWESWAQSPDILLSCPSLSPHKASLTASLSCALHHTQHWVAVLPCVTWGEYPCPYVPFLIWYASHHPGLLAFIASSSTRTGQFSKAELVTVSSWISLVLKGLFSVVGVVMPLLNPEHRPSVRPARATWTVPTGPDEDFWQCDIENASL